MSWGRGSLFKPLGFTQNPSDYDRRPDFIRIAFPGLGDQVDNYQGLLAGEFITIRFAYDVNDTGPFDFTWIHPEPCDDLNQNQVCEDISEPFTDVNNNGQHNHSFSVVQAGRRPGPPQAKPKGRH